MAVGEDISKTDLMKKLEGLDLSDYITVSILKILTNPPYEPNMKTLAPIMSALFPEVTNSIKAAFSNEADVTEWTREANEMLMKYSIDDQVRRDIIQGSITYYLFNLTNNRASLEDWIQRGGLR